MPSWLLDVILNLVLRFGIPYLISWLRRVAPWLPLDKIWPAIEAYLKDLESGVHHVEAKSTAKEKIKECYGVGCKTEVKED